jgi:hypothetical protein
VKTRALRVGGSACVSIFFCLESGCGTGQPARASRGGAPPPPAQATPAPSSPFKEESSSSPSDAYERLRVRVWEPSRRFKALFKAEVLPKVGAIGRGYLSVWWDGATGTLTWRASAPIAGSGRGGMLRNGGSDGASPFPGKLVPSDLIACILGVPDAPLSPSVAVDREGRVIETSFPSGEVVRFQPGEGVPRRIEANGPDGRAVLTLEAYSSWPEGEEVPRP